MAHFADSSSSTDSSVDYVVHGSTVSKDLPILTSNVYTFKSDNPIIISCYGCFSPPSIGHIRVANIVANFIHDLKEQPVIAYFVPVGENYMKESVKTSFIGKDSNLSRKEMLEICCQYLNSRQSRPIEFRISDHEMIHPTVLKTYESDEILMDLVRTSNPSCTVPDNNFYIALGQDNIEGILSGYWVNPFTLISKNLICVPRPIDSTSSVGTAKVIETLQNKFDPEKMSERQALESERERTFDFTELKEKILIVEEHIPVEIMTASSTQLRSNILRYRQNDNVTLDELHLLTLPEIVNYILENHLYPNL